MTILLLILLVVYLVVVSAPTSIRTRWTGSGAQQVKRGTRAVGIDDRPLKDAQKQQ